MTITVPPEATTGDSADGEARGEKDGMIELGYFIAREAELQRVLEAVA